MRKIIFHLEVGFAGMETTENGAYSDDTTDDELHDEAWLRAVQHAESYGYYPEEHRGDDDEMDEDCYSHNIEGWWEDYDPKKHGGLKPGGGEWQWVL